MLLINCECLHRGCAHFKCSFQTPKALFQLPLPQKPLWRKYWSAGDFQRSWLDKYITENELSAQVRAAPKPTVGFHPETPRLTFGSTAASHVVCHSSEHRGAESKVLLPPHWGKSGCCKQPWSPGTRPQSFKLNSNTFLCTYLS